MANERNKILPYALSAIEGVNIQSQEDYSASSETTDGVSTGLANGNNFNKLAKQVSIMSSSLAEFIVNTLSEQTISDANSIDEISSALNNAILKLIKDNKPIIPDQPGIKVIDDNSLDITSFNQLTEDGIYYVYKKLSDAPSYEQIFSMHIPINLIVINVKDDTYSLNECIQLTSINIDSFTLVPSNIGIEPFVRSLDKDLDEWGDWFNRFGISFFRNSISIEEFNTTNKTEIRFPIFAKNSVFPSSYNTFMYSATKEQMREQLGIQDPVEPVDTVEKWKTYTPAISGGRCLSAMYRIYDSEINGFSYKRINIMAIICINITLSNVNLYTFSISLPGDIKVYNNGVALKNGGMASIIYSLTGMSVEQTGGKAVNASACYSKSNGQNFELSYTLFGTFSGSTVQSAMLTFQIDALIDDRTLAPTPASIAVTKIQGNQVTITYTRGN